MASKQVSWAFWFWKLYFLIKIHLAWGNQHKNIQNYVQRLMWTNNRKVLLSMNSLRKSWGSRRLSYETLVASSISGNEFSIFGRLIIIPKCIDMKWKFHVLGSETIDLRGFKLWSLYISSKKNEKYVVPYS